MRPIVSNLLEDLSKDMVSHGWLVQAVNLEDPHLDWKSVLAELLAEGVEVGELHCRQQSTSSSSPGRGQLRNVYRGQSSA